MCTIFVHCALVWGSWAAAHSPLFGWFMLLKMRNFLRGALPRTPLGLPAPDPRLGLRPRPRVRRCRRPEAELRLQAKVARCRLSSKKIAIYTCTSGRRERCCIVPPFATPDGDDILKRSATVAARMKNEEQIDQPNFWPTGSSSNRRATPSSYASSSFSPSEQEQPEHAKGRRSRSK